MKSPEDCTGIEDIRESIDTLDRDIIRLIGERARYVEETAAKLPPENDSQQRGLFAPPGRYNRG